MGESENEPEQNRPQKLQERIQRMRQKAEEEERKKKLAARFVDEKAFDRLMVVKIGHPELFDNVVSILVRLSNGGQLRGKLTEEQLVRLLGTLTEKRESTIEFKRK